MPRLESGGKPNQSSMRRYGVGGSRDRLIDRRQLGLEFCTSFVLCAVLLAFFRVHWDVHHPPRPGKMPWKICRMLLMSSCKKVWSELRIVVRSNGIAILLLSP
jgi:hypothetical protein